MLPETGLEVERVASVRLCSDNSNAYARLTEERSFFPNYTVDKLQADCYNRTTPLAHMAVQMVARQFVCSYPRIAYACMAECLAMQYGRGFAVFAGFVRRNCKPHPAATLRLRKEAKERCRR
jgi:hypothetical protein